MKLPSQQGPVTNVPPPLSRSSRWNAHRLRTRARAATTLRRPEAARRRPSRAETSLFSFLLIKNKFESPSLFLIPYTAYTTATVASDFCYQGRHINATYIAYIAQSGLTPTPFGVRPSITAGVAGFKTIKKRGSMEYKKPKLASIFACLKPGAVRSYKWSWTHTTDFC